MRIYLDQEEQYWDDPISDGADTPGYRRKRRSLISKALTLIIPMLVIATTQAGNISLSGGRVEFGQGVVSLKSCTQTSDIKTKQSSTYTASGFALKTITLSNIPVSCYGFNLIVSVLKPGPDGSSELATLFTGVKKLYIYDRNGTFYTSQSDAAYVSLTSSHDDPSNTDSVVITFLSPSLLVSDFGTLGVESGENILTNLPCGLGGDCTVGATGPFGGTVAVYFTSPFSAPGSACNLKCYGLEIMTTDKNYIDVWSKIGTTATSGQVNATNHGIGAGYLNTKLAFTSAGGANNGTGTGGAISYCWNRNTTSPNDRWYLPSVMEYAYIFKQAKDFPALFNSATSGFPAVTDYYTSEEATGFNTGYQSIFNADGPPNGITYQGYPISNSPQRVISVAPRTAGGAAVNGSFADYAQLMAFDHRKDAGYAIICMHAFG